jgi:hypothetical protein
MKSMADFLGDLDCIVSDRNLVLNVLQGLKQQYDHLLVIITRSMPFPTFHKVWDELVLEEITLGPDTPVCVPRMCFTTTTPPAPPPLA